jgi:UDP-glucuronate decarboxylase
MAKDDGRVVSNFINQAIRNEPITVYGNGEQTRSFCYVDDLVNGLIAMMESGDDVIGPINLGNPTEFTMINLAKKVIEFTGSQSKIINMPLPQDDPKQRRPNISRAKELLNWEPSFDFDIGIKSTIKYFQSLL